MTINKDFKICSRRTFFSPKPFNHPKNILKEIRSKFRIFWHFYTEKEPAKENLARENTHAEHARLYPPELV